MSAIDYARYDYQRRRHNERYARRVEAMPHKLLCQECKGTGGWNRDWGPRQQCGWCCGTGFLTPWLRGLWLRVRREEKRAA